MNNPYVGPRTFGNDEQDRRRFFGREREAGELFSRVAAQRLVLFYAQSGAGKSSLVNTRLIPQLRSAGFAVLPVGRVGGDLPAEVDQVDNIYLFNLMLRLDQRNPDPRRFARLDLTNFLTNLTSDDGEQWYYDPQDSQSIDAAHQKLATHNPQPDFTIPNYVLIIDQFEEILTSHHHRWQEREEFFRALDSVIQSDPHLWVVLVLREDYVAGLDPYASLMTDKLRARYYMERMSIEAALEAVRRPAAEVGERPFAPGVAEKLVDDLRQIRVQGQDESQPGQYVEPVQLQVVCYQLWENLAAAEPRGFSPGATISEHDLQQAGDVNRALAAFYESALHHALSSAEGLSERALRNWFTEKLITEAGTRGTVYQGAEETAGLPNAIVRSLTSQFLLRSEIRAGGSWIELVHDRFIEPILQANFAWLQQQSPLLRAAQAWAEGEKSPQLLLGGQALINAYQEAAISRPDPLVSEFLAASRAQADVQTIKEIERQRQLELEQAQALARATEARLYAEQQRATEAEARRREQAEAAALLQRRARLLQFISGLAIALAVASIAFALYARWQSQVAERASLAAAEKSVAAESAATAAVAAKETSSAESANAAALANSLAVVLTSQAEAESTAHTLPPRPRPTADDPTPTPLPGETRTPTYPIAILPTVTPDLAKTATIEAIQAQLVQAQATQTVQAEQTAAAPQSQLLAVIPPIEMSLFVAADPNATVLEKLSPGARLPVRQLQESEWAQVEAPSGALGWVRARLVLYEGNAELLPADLRFRNLTDRPDLPVIWGVVVSFGGAQGDYLLSDPQNEQSGVRWISVGAEVIVLLTGEGVRSYGSGRWYFVVLADPNDRTRLLQGWLPAEVVGARR
jgi:hypothetical protein